MRRGSRSGPSDETANATSTFAASVCAVVVSPAAFRTIALRRGRTVRIRPSARPTQSPAPDVDALVDEPSGQPGADGAALRPDVEGAPVDGCDASRHETGLQVFGELGVPAELVQIESRQRKAPSRKMGRRTRPAEGASGARSERPRRQQRQASFVSNLLSPGTHAGYGRYACASNHPEPDPAHEAALRERVSRARGRRLHAGRHDWCRAAATRCSPPRRRPARRSGASRSPTATATTSARSTSCAAGSTARCRSRCPSSTRASTPARRSWTRSSRAPGRTWRRSPTCFSSPAIASAASR